MKLHSTLKKLNFKRCPMEHALYKREDKGGVMLVGVYVDDLIVTGSSEAEIRKFKMQMQAEYEMTDLGLLKYYLGLEVSQGVNGVTLKQSNYIEKVLKESGMWNANSRQYPMDSGLVLLKDEGGQAVDPTEYRKLVGCLRYITHTRPDVSYAVGIVSRYMEKPQQSHFLAVKQILRYLRGTLSYGIKYIKADSPSLVGYSDSSHAGDRSDGKSTTGMVFFYGNSPVAWCSQKQKTVALSSCEAEFMAATATACPAIWLKSVMEFMTGEKEGAVTLKVDNKSAIELMKNPVFHGRSKHINIRYHFIRECVDDKLVKVEFISGDQQKADVLTKALPRLKFLEMRKLIGVFTIV